MLAWELASTFQQITMEVKLVIKLFKAKFLLEWVGLKA